MVTEITESETLGKWGLPSWRFLQGKIDVNLHELRVGNSFLAMKPKEQIKKGKIDKLGINKIENFLHFKRHHQESKKTASRKRGNIRKLLI